MLLYPGYVVTLQSLGQTPGDTYLNGRTTTSQVDLAPNTNYPYTGTAWLLEAAGTVTVYLKCLGNLAGSRYLNGNTEAGTVNLVEGPTGPGATGTLWALLDGGDGSVILRCMGSGSDTEIRTGLQLPPSSIFLNGETGVGAVDLAPNTNNPYTGTRWAPALVLTEDQAQITDKFVAGLADVWQSFTAGVTGMMARLDVMAEAPTSGAVSGSIRVYQGEGTDGQLLADVPYDFPVAGEVFQECVFPTAFSIQEGEVYTYRLTAADNQIATYLAPPSYYTRGQSSFNNEVLVFKTWVMVDTTASG